MFQSSSGPALMRAMLILFTIIAFFGLASKINSPGQLVDVEVLIFGCGYC